VNDIPAEFLVCEADEGDTSIDLLMAQMLQMEFDKEADKMLKREQDNYNRNSKVRI
jgi:RIO kinase 3